MSIFRILCVVFVLFVSLGCEGNSLNHIKSKDKIRIGVSEKVPPIAYINENGELDGFEIKLAKKIAKDLLGDESKAELIIISPNERASSLESNQVDLVLATFIPRSGDEARVDFGTPYMKVAIIIVNHYSDPSGMQDLLDSPLAIKKNTVLEDYFTTNYPNIELIKFDNVQECLDKLQKDRNINVAILNATAFAWVRQNPQFKISIPILGDDYMIAPAVKKGDKALLKWINQEMDTLQKDGFFIQIYEASLQPFYGKELGAENLLYNQE